MFQSLFFWKWGFKTHPKKKLKIYHLFQSLFFWKWGFKFSRRPERSRRVICFNPCFSGSGVLSKTSGWTFSDRTTFQSLFFWKWGFKHIVNDQAQIKPGFNPCFSGSGVLSSGWPLWAITTLGFNPCFSGSGVLSRIAVRMQMLTWSFNPCFSGSGVLRQGN